MATYKDNFKVWLDALKAPNTKTSSCLSLQKMKGIARQLIPRYGIWHSGSAA
jgi:hypothetical protein